MIFSKRLLIFSIVWHIWIPYKIWVGKSFTLMCNSWNVSTHVLLKFEDKFTHTFEVDDFQQVLAVFFLYLTNLNPLRNLHLDISHLNIPDRTDSY